MYLWKYWRESRSTFAVGLLLVGLMLWVFLKTLGVVQHETQNVSPAQIYIIMDGILMLPVAFLGLRYGTFGVGRDLGEGSGSFLFSRPRSRTFFVWNDWGFGMAQLLLIVVAANSVLLWAVHHIAPRSGPMRISGVPVSLFSVFCLHCTAGLLLCGLMFGLTYFCSVLSKRHGLIMTLCVLVAYLLAKSIVSHHWPDFDLPNLGLTEFSASPSIDGAFARNLGLIIALRAALALAFPVAAQMLLQQRDID